MHLRLSLGRSRRAALACAAAFVALVIVAVSPSTDAGATRLHRYRDPLVGWVVTRPGGFAVEHSTGSAGLVVLEESTIADFRQRRAIHVHTTRHLGETTIGVTIHPPLDRAGRFPADGVAFRVVEAAGGPYIRPTRPTRLPLSLRSFRRQSPSPPQPRGVPRPLMREVSLGRRGDVTVEAWIGRRASALQRRAVARMVASLRFPPPSKHG